MSKIKKSKLLKRIVALEEDRKQAGVGNQFITLNCIQGNRFFTFGMNYCASNVGDRVLATHNFGGRTEVVVNTNIFGGYKHINTDHNAVFIVKGCKGVKSE